MTKFIEIFEYVGTLEHVHTCSCCKHESNGAYVYETNSEIIALCANCKNFIEGVLE